MAESFKVEGLRELEAKLKVLRESFGEKTGGFINRGLLAGARIIQADAKRRAPNKDPSGLLRERVAVLTSGKFKYGRAGKALSKSRAAQKEANRQGIVLARQLALIRQNIIAHYVRADIPTVIVRVRSRGYTLGANSVRAALSGKQSIRFRNPGVSPGYWWWLEFGTSRMRARPYLRPAFNANKERAVIRMREAIAAEIRKKYPLVAGPIKVGV